MNEVMFKYDLKNFDKNLLSVLDASQLFSRFGKLCSRFGHEHLKQNHIETPDVRQLCRRIGTVWTFVFQHLEKFQDFELDA